MRRVSHDAPAGDACIRAFLDVRSVDQFVSFALLGTPYATAPSNPAGRRAPPSRSSVQPAFGYQVHRYSRHRSSLLRYYQITKYQDIEIQNQFLALARRVPTEPKTKSPIFVLPCVYMKRGENSV